MMTLELPRPVGVMTYAKTGFLGISHVLSAILQALFGFGVMALWKIQTRVLSRESRSSKTAPSDLWYFKRTHFSIR